MQSHPVVVRKCPCFCCLDLWAVVRIQFGETQRCVPSLVVVMVVSEEASPRAAQRYLKGEPPGKDELQLPYAKVFPVKLDLDGVY